MSNLFENISPYEIEDNLFTSIGDEWMLITAGSMDSFNTMTASWGTMGILWSIPIAICFVRPQRYTFQFMERAKYYTLSFFDPSDKHILQFCGTHSGRDTDKMKETGLIPLETGNGSIFFKQARMAIECKILYSDRLEGDHFHVKELIGKNYPSKDFHTFYIGEIVNCYKKK